METRVVKNTYGEYKAQFCTNTGGIWWDIPNKKCKKHDKRFIFDSYDGAIKALEKFEEKKE